MMSIMDSYLHDKAETNGSTAEDEAIRLFDKFVMPENEALRAVVEQLYLNQITVPEALNAVFDAMEDYRKTNSWPADCEIVICFMMRVCVHRECSWTDFDEQSPLYLNLKNQTWNISKLMKQNLTANETITMFTGGIFYPIKLTALKEHPSFPEGIFAALLEHWTEYLAACSPKAMTKLIKALIEMIDWPAWDSALRTVFVEQLRRICNKTVII